MRIQEMIQSTPKKQKSEYFSPKTWPDSAGRTVTWLVTPDRVAKKVYARFVQLAFSPGIPLLSPIAV